MLQSETKGTFEWMEAGVGVATLVQSQPDDMDVDADDFDESDFDDDFDDDFEAEIEEDEFGDDDHVAEDFGEDE